jgi:hypothetical protein
MRPDLGVKPGYSREKLASNRLSPAYSSFTKTEYSHNFTRKSRVKILVVENVFLQQAGKLLFISYARKSVT